MILNVSQFSPLSTQVTELDRNFCMPARRAIQVACSEIGFDQFAEVISF